MSELTDTQLVTLSAASQREDRGIVLPPNLKGGAAQKFVAKLIELGFVEEIRARGDLPAWRRDDEEPMALRLYKIEAATPSIDDIAARESCSARHVNMTISLAFLAPHLVQLPSKAGCRTALASLA